MNKTKIGIPLIGSSEWMGGVTYVELLVKAARCSSLSNNINLFLIVKQESLSSLKLHSDFLHYFSGVIFVGDSPASAGNYLNEFIHCENIDEVFKKVDFCFPFFTKSQQKCFAAWIPDFQHRYLPNFFSRQELKIRDQHYTDIANFSKVVVLSSKDAEKDFKKFYPHSKSVTRVLNFHTLPIEEWFKPDPIDIQKKYHLPDDFIICCNQFWKHKNHELLFKAILKLKKSGYRINLVCTGAKNDYRFKNYFSQLNNFVNKNNLQDRIHILGLIPRNDQIQLIRKSKFLIQPSLFEGWSTVVEDARALGKTILLSDLSVNYEQSPKYSTYFKRNNLNDLVNKILLLSKTFEPGPNFNREKDAKMDSLKLIEEYGDNFIKIAYETIKLCKK